MSAVERHVVFTWQGRRGLVLVGGHDISDQVTALTVDATARELPLVTLTVLGVQHVEGQARVAVDEDTAALLVELGWTPPPGPLSAHLADPA